MIPKHTMKHDLAEMDEPAGAPEAEEKASKGMAGALTLMKGLDVLTRVSKGDNTLGKMAKSLGINKTTVHRLATTLVEANYLSFHAARWL